MREKTRGEKHEEEEGILIHESRLNTRMMKHTIFEGQSKIPKFTFT